VAGGHSNPEAIFNVLSPKGQIVVRREGQFVAARFEPLTCGHGGKNSVAASYLLWSDGHDGYFYNP